MPQHLNDKGFVLKRKIPAYIKFLIGGASGMMSVCLVQPMDLIKVRMQLMGADGLKPSAKVVIRSTLRNEGVTGFYTGLSASLLRQATYTTVRLGIFNIIIEWYRHHHQGHPRFGLKLALGVFAGGIGAFIGTPAEVCLVRMMADGRLPPDQRSNYTSVFNAINRIVSEEGVRTLWRGVDATVTRAMVTNGAQLGTYAHAREKLLHHLSEGVLLHFCASMIAGIVTVIASQPVDTVKTRVQNAAEGSRPIRVLLNMIRKEGPLALWSGFWPSYARMGPHTVFTFMFLEQFRLLYYRMSS